MKNKMTIHTAIIEITRRCNMKCEHCLRGDAENCDINQKDIDSFMEKVSYISSLTITGGEPSLKPKTIRYIIQSAKKHEVSIGNFYVATNAKKITEEFVLSLLSLWLYCEENEISVVHWSNDQYHENSREGIKMLRALSFASARYEDTERNNRLIIPEGRAKYWGEGLPRSDYGFEIDEERVTEGAVYLNAKGQIISGCDWSYENQEDHFVCDIDELSIDKLEAYEKDWIKCNTSKDN